MSSPTLVKIAAKTAAEVCQRFKLEETSQKLLREDMSPRQFLDVLMQKQQPLDAIRLLAFGLPKAEAVWWACLCVRSVAKPGDKAAAALRAAEAWVADPSEENRRAAYAAGESAELATPAGCAAVAAFWSGGSLAPPNVPAVPPGEFMTALGVAGAIMLAGVQSEPEKVPEKHRKFIELGIEVASGTNRWKESAKK